MSTDEWEYEYSTTDSESLYFTLDLTTHVPDALRDQPNFVSGQASKNNSAPRQDPSSSRRDDDSSGEEDADGDEIQETLPTLQILDLHNSNPLIKFNQAVYSAYWTTDLGTQFHIAQSGQVSDPIRKGTVLDVLGLSRARLLGRPVQLIDRNAPPKAASTVKPAQTASTAIDVDADEEYDNDNTTLSTAGPLKIPKTILKTTKSKSQASFLERLSVIKHAKGEKDQVPILAVKHYTKPANADEIKRKAEDDDRNNALPGADGKKRRRRRPMGVKARNAGGAGRPSREGIEGSLGLGGPGEVGGDGRMEEGGFGTGMFEPGGRGEIREEVAGYLEDPFRVQGSGGPEQGGSARHSAMPAMQNLPSSTTAIQQGAGESNGEAGWTPSGVDSNGYLSYQPRAEYVSTVRAEAAIEAPSQPLRPPWMGDGAGKEQEQEYPQEENEQNDAVAVAEAGAGATDNTET